MCVFVQCQECKKMCLQTFISLRLLTFLRWHPIRPSMIDDLSIHACNVYALLHSFESISEIRKNASFRKRVPCDWKGGNEKKVLCRGSCRVRFFPATQNPFVSKKQTLFCVFLFHNFVSAMPYVRINLPTLKQVVHFKWLKNFLFFLHV